MEQTIPAGETQSKNKAGFLSRLNIMGALQLLGRSLMLPIAVLPVAGILLRLGQPDLLDIPAISAAGGAIFTNLALIFAIGVAIGLAKDNHGSAALAGATAFLVLNATLNILDKNLDMGVLGGIICGIVAGIYYNRYNAIKMPDYLAFFGGRRFIPIISGATALLLAYIFAYIWPPVEHGISSLGNFMIESGNIGLFFYGLFNRLLIVTGLHHILNNLVWFQFGSFTDAAGEIIRGDMSRFFAGDKTAGIFMAGMFPVTMFGLPAVALAIYCNAKAKRRPVLGGLLLSMGLTSFLTGITEPIEFSFMFLAPALYAVHAFLTGLAMIIVNLLDVKLGFTFSAGAFDYILSYGKATHPLWLIPIGFTYFAIYYCIFSAAIRLFNLKTQGRESEPSESPAEARQTGGNIGQDFVAALGGGQNLSSIGACTTRLRLTVRNQDKIDEMQLKQLGAVAVMKMRNDNVQIILGPIADDIAQAMRSAVGAGDNDKTIIADKSSALGTDAAPLPASLHSAPINAAALADWVTAFGGHDNLRKATAIAATRLRLEVADTDALDSAAVTSLGAAAVEILGKELVHIIFNSQDLPRILAARLSP